MLLPYLRFIAGGLIGLGLSATPVFAQDRSDVDELLQLIELQQQQLEVQQEQLRKQQQQLDSQRQLLQDLQIQVESLDADADEDAETVADEKPQAEPDSKPADQQALKSVAIAEQQKYDRESPTSSNVTYFDPAKTINIPGNDTSIGFHGFVEFQIIHDSDGLDNNRFDTATIPVDGAPPQTKFSVNPTQLAISSQTPVSQGQVNTMISMDFNGQIDKADPRLRVAYGEYVNSNEAYAVLAGQTYTTTLDLRAVPETLDFAGPAAMWQTRQPLLRYTKAVSQSFVGEAAIETPENANYINGSRLTRWPDFSLAGTWHLNDKSLKHIRLAALARDLRASEDTTGAEDSAFGWALTGSAKLGLPSLGAKDNLKLTLHYGDGYGTQIKGGPREGAFDVGGSELETIEIFGAFGGIQHFWDDRFRSNLVLGYVDTDNPDFLSGDTFKSTTYFALNLIWTPFENSTIGAEYLWGERENEDGTKGDANRFLLHTNYSF